MKIEQVSPDGLSSKEWRFWPHVEDNRFVLTLNFYGEFRRPTKRHKWVADKFYCRQHHDRQHYPGKCLGQDEVSIPAEVEAEVRRLAGLVITKHVRP